MKLQPKEVQCTAASVQHRPMDCMALGCQYLCKFFGDKVNSFFVSGLQRSMHRQASGIQGVIVVVLAVIRLELNLCTAKSTSCCCV